MRIYTSLNGVEDLIAPGYPLPIVFDRDGIIVESLLDYTVSQIAANIWTTPDSARSVVESIVDVLAYSEDQGVPLEKLSVLVLKGYETFKRQTGIRHPCSKASTGQCIDATKRYWTFCERNQYVTNNSLVSVSEYIAPRSDYDPNAIRLPNLEEIRRFARSLRGVEARHASPLTFGVGMRRTEIVGLSANAIRPLHQMMVGDQGQVLLHLDGVHSVTKGGVARTVEVPIKLYSSLYAYKISPRRAARCARGKNIVSSLFVTKYGAPYQRRWLNDVFRRASQESETAIYPHLGRHWYATRFMEHEPKARFHGSEFRALQRLQQLLGHAFLESTKRYVHLTSVTSHTGAPLHAEYQRRLNELVDAIMESNS